MLTFNPLPIRVTNVIDIINYHNKNDTTKTYKQK